MALLDPPVTSHEAHGRCISCGYPTHRYPFGWAHVGSGMFACPTLAPLPTCCDEHRACPDDGACHHECDRGRCFRVECCEPLSGVFADDRWPSPPHVSPGSEAA